MSLLKCKCCGGDLNIKDGDKVVTCPYCGSQQTIPNEKDEQVLKIYARRNRLRSQGEFDKAYSTYSQLLNEGKENAEVYWNLLLCKYGITYVDDYDGKKKPTMNRRSMTSILDDDDYKKAIELSDSVSKEVYEQEANRINDIQKGILKIVHQEEPYDVFISYKETDEFGDRTKDSMLAQEIYDALTKDGYRVFLSRVTLSNVIGKEYEPYIYSALYTAKLMLLVTTEEEHVNSIWVKNEWSRFVDRRKTDSSKNLIPCYRDRDPYDLPKELRNLQGLDRGKLGFIQDLTMGVEKILGKKNENKEDKIVKSDTKSYGNIDAKLERCKLLIEAGQCSQAEERLNELVNEAPTNWEVYYYLLQCKTNDYSSEFFDDDNNFKWFLKFCPDESIKSKEKDFLYSNLCSRYHIFSERLSDDTQSRLKAGVAFTEENIKNRAEQENQLIEIRNKLFDLSSKDAIYKKGFLKIDKTLPFYEVDWDEGYFDLMIKYPQVEFGDYFSKYSYSDSKCVDHLNMSSIKGIYLKNDRCFVLADQLYIIHNTKKLDIPLVVEDGEEVLDSACYDYWFMLRFFISIFDVLKQKVFDFYYVSDEGEVFDYKGKKVIADEAKQVQATIDDFSKQDEERQKQAEEKKKEEEKQEEEKKKLEEEKKKQEEEKKKEEERARKAREIELQKAERREFCNGVWKRRIILAAVGLLVGIISLIVLLVGGIGFRSLFFSISGFVWFAGFLVGFIIYYKKYKEM